MRKRELIHMNCLCTEIGQTLIEHHDLEQDEVLEAYETADVGGPHDVTAPKKDQKELLFNLISDITTVIEEEARDDTETDADTGGEKSTVVV